MRPTIFAFPTVTHTPHFFSMFGKVYKKTVKMSGESHHQCLVDEMLWRIVGKLEIRQTQIRYLVILM